MAGDARTTDSAGAQNRGERLILIANPRAGGGRAGAARDAILRAADRAFANVDVRWTEGPGHATELAGKAAGEADIVAALGGDGTCSEVVNGLVPDGVPVNRKIVFGVVPFGTGGDLVRSLEVRRPLDKAFWTLATGMTIPLDLGRYAWDGGRSRVFVNVAGVGANADVSRRANASSKRLGGFLTFLGALMGSLREFSAMPIRWSWDGPDGKGELEMDTFAAFCANGHYCGGGMWIGNGGSMADGVFELTIVPTPSARLAAALLPRVYDGRFREQPQVTSLRISTVRVDAPIVLEADGESIGAGPARIDVLPRALQVRGGWLQPPRGPASTAG